MKILYIVTVGGTIGFFKSLIKDLIDNGSVVDIACGEPERVPSCFNEWGCFVYPIDCSRLPIKNGNIKAIKQIKEIVEKEKYDIVHCHTPIAAAYTRLACKSLRKKNMVKVIYTAHGFHFYAGAPLMNWLVYYPIEKWLSRYTDVLITINNEDYFRAKKKFRAVRIEYVPGVGIDVDRFIPCTEGRERIRNEMGLSSERVVLLSVGELNDNKNHERVIRAIEGLDITYVIAGAGYLKERLELIAKELKVDVRLVGYRKDVKDFYNAADFYILPSKREGLNVSLMEAMACGLPCLVGRIRGNVDLIEDSLGGCLFNPLNEKDIRLAIEKELNNSCGQGAYNRVKIKSFCMNRIIHAMKSIYDDVSILI